MYDVHQTAVAAFRAAVAAGDDERIAEQEEMQRFCETGDEEDMCK